MFNALNFFLLSDTNTPTPCDHSVTNMPRFSLSCAFDPRRFILSSIFHWSNSGDMTAYLVQAAHGRLLRGAANAHCHFGSEAVPGAGVSAFEKIAGGVEGSSRPRQQSGRTSECDDEAADEATLAPYTPSEAYVTALRV
jgi:hypothetical protein